MSIASTLPIQLTNATLRRQGKVIVGPIDLSVEGQGITMIIGPNGAGKTSILRMLHGLDALSAGSLHWQGGTKRVRAKQGYVFQTPVLLRRNVLENLIYPLKLRGASRIEATKRAMDALAHVGLKTFAQHPARTLSGGERQKLALARALIHDPELLLLDEPCASLDGNATKAIEAILLSARKTGTRILMTTHDMGQARRLADDVLFVLKGRIHESSGAKTFFTAPKTPEAHAFLKGDILP